MTRLVTQDPRTNSACGTGMGSARDVRLAFRFCGCGIGANMTAVSLDRCVVVKSLQTSGSVPNRARKSKSGAKPGMMTNADATAELLRTGGRRIAFIETRLLGMVPDGTMRLFVNDDIDADGNRWCEIHHPSLAAILPGLAIPVVNERLQPIQCRPTWPTRKAT